MKHIGDRIRQARENLGLSQEELAARIGKTQPSLSLYESGKRGIHIKDFPLLAKALNVPIGYFFGEDDIDDELLSIVYGLNDEHKQQIVKRLRLEVQIIRDG